MPLRSACPEEWAVPRDRASTDRLSEWPSKSRPSGFVAARRPDPEGGKYGGGTSRSSTGRVFDASDVEAHWPRTLAFECRRQVKGGGHWCDPRTGEAAVLLIKRRTNKLHAEPTICRRVKAPRRPMRSAPGWKSASSVDEDADRRQAQDRWRRAIRNCQRRAPRRSEEKLARAACQARRTATAGQGCERDSWDRVTGGGEGVGGRSVWSRNAIGWGRQGAEIRTRSASRARRRRPRTAS